MTQSFDNFELLIQDDGSSDSTLEMIAEVCAGDPRIRLEQNERNMGIGYSYAVATSRARGEFIAQIGHDDLWSPSFLEQMQAALAQDRSASAYFCRATYVDQEGRPLPYQKIFLTERLGTGRGFQNFLDLFDGNFLCAASSLCRRSALTGGGPMVRSDYLQDWLTWLMLLLRGDLNYLDQSLAQYRVHGTNFALNLPSRAQHKLEIRTIRLLVLAEPGFAKSLVGSPSGDKNFVRLTNCYLQSPPAFSDQPHRFLYQALATNEVFLCGLPSARQLIGQLLWIQGEFLAAQRYIPRIDAVILWPALNSRWRRYVFIFRNGRRFLVRDQIWQSSTLPRLPRD